MDISFTQFPEGSVYSVEEWPRGTMAGDMLMHMTRFEQANAVIVVDVSTWQSAVDHIVERWYQNEPDHGTMDADALASKVYRCAQDARSGQSLLVWKDGSALLARVGQDARFTVHPEVLSCLHPVFDGWWDQPDVRVGWEQVPEAEALVELGDMRCVPAFLPHHTGILASWSNLCWISPQASPVITETLVDAACWVGVQTDVWPKKWVALVQARSVSSFGEMTEPQVFWKDRFARFENGVEMDDEDESDDGLFEQDSSSVGVADASAPLVLTAAMAVPVDGLAVDGGEEVVANKPSYVEAHGRALGAMRAWLCSASSPLAGIFGVQQGTPGRCRDKAGYILAALIAPPTDWDMEERATRAADFAARFMEENITTVVTIANLL